MNEERIAAPSLKARGSLPLTSEPPFFFCSHARIWEHYFARLGNFLKGVKNIFPIQSTFRAHTQKKARC